MATKKAPKKTKKQLDIKKGDENVFTMVKNGVKSQQFPLVMGVILFLFAVFCFISFVSFFYTLFTDYESIKNLSAYELIKGEENIGNWGGRLGAFIAYSIISNTFGFGAFGFVLILVLFSLRLLQVKVAFFSKWLISTMVIMLWLSCILGYVFVLSDEPTLENCAGLIGISVAQGLCVLMGKIGCAIVLLAFTITIPMLLFGVKYLWVRKQTLAAIESIKQKPEKEDSKIDTEKTLSAENKEDKDNTSKKENTNIESNPLKPIHHTSKRQTQQSSQEQNDKSLDFKVRTENSDDVDKKDYKQNEEAKNVPQQAIELSTDTKKDEVNNQNDNIPFSVNTQTEISTEEESEEESEQEHMEIEHHTINEPYDPRLDLPSFQFPSTDMLIDYDKNNIIVSASELNENKDRIVSTLRNYSIEIASIQATPGPTVTLYEIVPAPGIRISKIKSLEDDIALSLSALGIRIIAPIPGKGTIGIEVPNSRPQIVSMKSMLESTAFKESKAELPIALGKKIDNTPYITDLTKMPHLLMAGATGQGKSVGLNAIVSSLLYKKHPSELKFVFVDPKKVELSLYSRLEKHYLAKIPDGGDAILTDVKLVVRTLKSLCALMDKRYDLLKTARCKTIKEYNKKFLNRRLSPTEGHDFMPYIVLVIDEFADLIMTAGKEIEKPICRLAQLARAVGIHLIIATQRPSVNVITGLIKANFPARAAFKVSSKVDSRTILDTSGAEQLVGRGDMLVANGGGPLIRLQCALIDTDEIEKIADFIGDQQGYAECYPLPEVQEDESEESEDKKEMDGDKFDSRLEEAARLIVGTQQGSTSLIQRKLALGYNRAGRIMDQLEILHIVGPASGSKPREVRVHTEEELNEILSHLNDSQHKEIPL